MHGLQITVTPFLFVPRSHNAITICFLKDIKSSILQHSLASPRRTPGSHVFQSGVDRVCDRYVLLGGGICRRCLAAHRLQSIVLSSILDIRIMANLGWMYTGHLNLLRTAVTATVHRSFFSDGPSFLSSWNTSLCKYELFHLTRFHKNYQNSF